MAAPQKLINGLTDLGMEKMQEYLDHYSELVNKGEKSFSEALEELVDIEKEKQTDTTRCDKSTYSQLSVYKDFG